MDNLLRMEKISKSFPGVKALDSVHFELKRGEVHAIAGENGAGKSTFMKVLTGIYKQDEGEIYYKGNLFLPENPKHAQEMGISIIHQELNLLPDLSVANNIYISREPRKVRGIIDDKEMNEKAQALLDSMGLSINAQMLSFKSYISSVTSQRCHLGHPVEIHFRLCLRKYLAAITPIQQEVETEAFVRECMVPPHYKTWIGIAHLYCIPFTFNSRKAFMVALGLIDNIPFDITHESLTINISDRTTFHQLHRITG